MDKDTQKKKAFMTVLVALVIVVPSIVAIKLYQTSASPHKVVLQFDGYHSSLETSILDCGDGIGIKETFACDLTFKVSNIGEVNSSAFLIFVDTSNVQYAVSISPITILPLAVGESRTVALAGYSGRGYPCLWLQYPNTTVRWYFGDNETVTCS